MDTFDNFTPVLVQVIRDNEKSYFNILGEENVISLVEAVEQGTPSSEISQSLVGPPNQDIQEIIQVFDEIVRFAKDCIVLYVTLRPLLKRPVEKEDIEEEIKKVKKNDLPRNYKKIIMSVIENISKYIN